MKLSELRSLGFLIIVLIAPSRSIAACSHETDSRYPAFHAEKKWPLHPDLTIKVSATFQEGSSYSAPPDEMGLYDLYVELVSTRDRKTIAEVCDEGALSSDAMSLHGISIDTAPYILSKATHAFGVRAGYGNNSRSNPASTSTLTLFGVTGRKIRRLLKTTEMGGRFDEISLTYECQGTFTERSVTIALGEERDRGMADLIVSTVDLEGSLAESGNSCAETPTGKKVRKQNLVFDGIQYK